MRDVGGMVTVNVEVRPQFVLWMVQCYLGEPGHYGMVGYNRPVFYSNVAAPKIKQIFAQAGTIIRDEFEAVCADKAVKAAVSDKHIARRLETLRDLIATDSDP